MLDEEIEIKDSISTQQLSGGVLSKDYKFKGKIEFRNVNFFYNEGEHVITDLSFLVNPGEHVAFVGPTGSGKTTIIRLLCRLYEPLRQLAERFTQIQGGLTAVERINEL